jgi:propionate CoA-transferase
MPCVLRITLALVGNMRGAPRGLLHNLQKPSETPPCHSYPARQPDVERNIFFINFEGVEIRTAADIEEIRISVAQCLAPLKRKVPAIVNYDNFAIAPELMDDYIAMVRDLTERFYSRVTRYSTSTFMRSYFGQALRAHDAEPALYATPEEALSQLMGPAGKAL